MPVNADLDAVTQLAGTDRRAARQLLDIQRAQAVAAARITADDADADRQLRVSQQRQRLAADERAERLHKQEHTQARREQRRAALAEHRTRRRHARRAQAAAAVAYLHGRADDAYAATMYALAVGGAVFGQITAATSRGWPLAAGLLIAAAIEGLALVMALTAQKLRLAGEAARTPRALTWICAGSAATINYLGHVHTDRVGAVLLAMLSLAGIIVWEIRSGAAHRLELRARGLLPDPPATFGARRWARFLPSTLAAWSIDVRDRVSSRSARLLELAAAEHHQRQADREHQQIRQLARRTVAVATRRGHYAAALAALTRMAEHGRSGPGTILNGGPAQTLTRPAGPNPDPDLLHRPSPARTAR